MVALKGWSDAEVGLGMEKSENRLVVALGINDVLEFHVVLRVRMYNNSVVYTGVINSIAFLLFFCSSI